MILCMCVCVFSRLWDGEQLCNVRWDEKRVRVCEESLSVCVWEKERESVCEECVCVCVRRECVCVRRECVCVWERECVWGECVSVFVRERVGVRRVWESVCEESVLMCVWERVCVWERECVCGRERISRAHRHSMCAQVVWQVFRTKIRIWQKFGFEVTTTRR